MLPWLNSKSAAVQAVASVLNFLALLASVVVTGFLVVEERWLMRDIEIQRITGFRTH
jgi:hypothetical protein